MVRIVLADRRKTRTFLLPAVLASLGIALLSACGDDPATPGELGPPPPDGIPPELEFAYPRDDQTWDADSDGLMDVRLQWSDSAGVDPTSLELSVLDQDYQVLREATALAERWVVEATSTGARLEETVAARLPVGTWYLRAVVSDSTGTKASAMAGRYTLPPLTLHRSVPLGDRVRYHLGYCPGREELYATGDLVSIIDSHTFEVRQVERPHGNLYTLTCSGDSPWLVSTPHLKRLDVESLTWSDGAQPAGLVGALDVQPSPSELGGFIALAWITGDSLEARVMLLDSEADSILEQRHFQRDFPRELATAGTELIVGTWTTGLWTLPGWADPASEPMHLYASPFYNQDLELASAGTRAFTLDHAQLAGNGSVVFEIELPTGREIRSRWLAESRVHDIAVNRAGDRIFAPSMTCDGESCSVEPPYLLRTGECYPECVSRMPLPKDVAGLWELDQAVFRSDDAFLFWMTRDAAWSTSLHVYLQRPQLGVGG